MNAHGTRLRIGHTKLGKVRFTSHRDTARHWERALRKAGFAVATSGGFTPRPKLSFGLALPTGAESLAEYLDVEFAEPVATDDPLVRQRMTEALPSGYHVTRVGVAEGSSLQEIVVACTWWIGVRGPAVASGSDAVAVAVAAGELPIERERKGQRRVDDIRPAIESLEWIDDPADVPAGGATIVDPPGILVTLSTSDRGVRPLELVTAIFPGVDALDVASRVVRIEQWTERDGVREHVLAMVDATRCA